MIKRLFFGITFLAGCLCMNAQKQLSITDVSTPNDVHPCLEKKEFKAVFRCDKALSLSFVSDFHTNGKIDILSETVDTVGNQLVYTLIFPSEQKGTSLDGRKLSIYADGFNRYDIPRFNFPTHTKKVYEVKDPYAKLQNPYYAAINKASEYFTDGNYTDAKAQYLISKETPEYLTNSTIIDHNIEMIDSITGLIEVADKAFSDIKYMEAMKLYTHILKLNPNDAYVRNKIRECTNAHANDCSSYYQMAEDMYKIGEFESAKEYYNKVIDSDCSFKSMAVSKLLMVEKRLQTTKNKERFLTYEYHKDVPIGLSFGKCKNKGTGGFFTLRTNSDAIKLIRDEPSLDLLPEVNVSFGWTLKVVAPVWLFFGPGYTGMGYYNLRESAIGKAENELEKDDYSFKLRSAISPEAGVIVKLWHFNLKYSFQYRYALDSADEEHIKDMRHYIGVGFCW